MYLSAIGTRLKGPRHKRRAVATRSTAGRKKRGPSLGMTIRIFCKAMQLLRTLPGAAQSGTLSLYATAPEIPGAVVDWSWTLSDADGRHHRRGGSHHHHWSARLHRNCCYRLAARYRSEARCRTVEHCTTAARCKTGHGSCRSRANHTSRSRYFVASRWAVAYSATDACTCSPASRSSIRVTRSLAE